ncbi:MAG: hypothetical protein ACXVA9_00635 [Bdellovibrionales bacterium]
MKLFLKLFVFTAIPFGTFMGLMAGVQEGLEAGVRMGIFQGIFFGSFMALVLGSIHRRECNRIAGEELAPHQSLKIELLAGSLNAVFERATQAVKDFGGKIKESDPKSGSISARVPASWKSFGEILTIQVTNAGDSKYEVQISSRPRFRATIIDYGKSRENIENVANRLINR